MKNKIWFIYLISILLLFNCKKAKETHVSKVDAGLINSSLVKAINYGSREDYILADNELSILSYSDERFYCSYLVATKYKYPEAYFSLFECLKPNREKKANGIEVQNFGNQSDVFRLYFLLKSYELVKQNDRLYPIIKKEVEEKFRGRNKIPKSKDYLIDNLE